MPRRSSTEVFRGRLFRVRFERWTEPDREREVVRHPGGVAVVPLVGDRVLLVRQLREALGERLLEIPAGISDVEGEAPEETATRELAEETGYSARSIRPLGRIHPSPGMSDEVILLFVADVDRAGDPEGDVQLVEMPLAEAVAAVRKGDITDAKTAVALLLVGAR